MEAPTPIGSFTERSALNEFIRDSDSSNARRYAGAGGSLQQSWRSQTEGTVHAVVVVRHGKLVFEAYAAGDDENWGEPLGNIPHDAATKHDMMSISKSVVSLLFGIAIERKLIAGTDTPVLAFFSEYAE